MADEKRTVRVVDTERFPFFRVTRTNAGHSVEVEPETLARWERVMGEFEDVQNEMEALHDKAMVRAAEQERVARAEAELAVAQRRADKARHDIEHPPYELETWPAPGDDSCVGWDYGDEKTARAERIRIHDTWPSITFDVVHYWCAGGHVHLRRRA